MLITLTDSWRGHRILDEGAASPCNRGDRRRCQPLSAPLGAQDWAGSRLHQRLQARRHRRQQRERHVLRHRPQQLSHLARHDVAAGRWHRADSGDPHSRAAFAARRPELLTGSPPCAPRCWRTPSLPPRSATSTGSRTPPATPSMPCSTMRTRRYPHPPDDWLEGTLGFIAEVVLDTVPEYPQGLGPAGVSGRRAGSVWPPRA